MKIFRYDECNRSTRVVDRNARLQWRVLDEQRKALGWPAFSSQIKIHLSKDMVWSNTIRLRADDASNKLNRLLNAL